MFYIIEFILFVIFFSFKLYSLLDNYMCFSRTGGKLNKYIKNLKNITCSFNVTEFIKKFNLKCFFNTLSCWCKQISCCLFVSTVILVLKICISYNFFVSNCLLINLFNKTFDISQFLNNKYTVFKITYYMLFFLFVFCYINKLYCKYISFKNLNNSIEEGYSNEFHISINSEGDDNIVIPDNITVLNKATFMCRHAFKKDCPHIIFL